MIEAIGIDSAMMIALLSHRLHPTDLDTQTRAVYTLLSGSKYTSLFTTRTQMTIFFVNEQTFPNTVTTIPQSEFRVYSTAAINLA